ncbi:MAG: hypothetical protein NT045_05180, partial [Candidatus Aureabacteria bacterium]|nr:hypothetical protein [Candidatus Auribacterota bacterium]
MQKGLKKRALYFPHEFQISKERWDFYDLSRGVFPEKGEVRAPDFRVLRLLVQRIYEKKDLTAFAHAPLRAGHLNATGLINEIFRCIIRRYCDS